MENKYAPIVVFCYKRKEHLKACVESLKKCECINMADVIVFSDGYKGASDMKDVLDVRAFLGELEEDNNFNKLMIVNRPTNFGLAKSVITGVNEVLEKYEEVIVVEDDLVLSKDFYVFMNDGLNYYRDKPEYGSISAYTYPLNSLKHYKKDIYALRKGDCWGWATWRDRFKKTDWELRDFDKYLNDKKRRKEFSSLEQGLEQQLIAQHNGRLDAWAARWIFGLYNNNLITVYPRICRAINIGLDGSGTNCEVSKELENSLNISDRTCIFEPIHVNKRIEREIGRIGRPGIIHRIVMFAKNVK